MHWRILFIFNTYSTDTNQINTPYMYKSPWSLHGPVLGALGVCLVIFVSKSSHAVKCFSMTQSVDEKSQGYKIPGLL